MKIKSFLETKAEATGDQTEGQNQNRRQRPTRAEQAKTQITSSPGQIKMRPWIARCPLLDRRKEANTGLGHGTERTRQW
jgi:hypothetical protein